MINQPTLNPLFSAQSFEFHSIFQIVMSTLSSGSSFFRLWGRGVVYTHFNNHCNNHPYRSWLFGASLSEGLQCGGE
jgi:hypothetical protein